ncbi:MAG TPA: hypothetical protein VIF15_02190 [Polyangiaceae bacterium]
MPKVAKLAIITECQNILKVLDTTLAGVPSFLLEGQTYTRQELRDIFQSAIDATRKTEVANVAWLMAVDAAKDTYKRVRLVRNAFKHAMESTHGKGSLLVTNLALGTKAKPAKPTAETQVAAAEKRKATRAARHTMGRKQRLKIKG